MRRNKGEGSITVSIRNGKKYYRGYATIGYDAEGEAIRKYFGSFNKRIVLDKIRNAKYEAEKNMLSSNSKISFGDLFLKWIQEYKRNEVKNNTYDDYLTCYKLCIKPYPISNMKMSEINLDMLQQYFNSLKSIKSANGLKKVHMKVNSCFKFANSKEIITKNICKDVILPKIQKKKDDEYKVFTREEQKRICEILDFNNPVDQVIYFTFYTGLRLGEVLAVRWERIKGNMYEVREQYQRDTIFLDDGSKKTIYVFTDLLKTPHAEREVPLPSIILEFLEKIKNEHSLVFCDWEGEPLERKKPDRRIKRLCKKLEIDDSRTFYSVRHSYCTRLFEANVPIKTVQVLMGHADVETTMNIYTHVMKDKKLEIIDVLNNI
ncbi:tyrosine-type recombinase/integrase [Fusobacterium gonidiaformans]